MRNKSRLAKCVVPLVAVGAALALPSAASAQSGFPLRAWWPLAEGKGQVIRDWSFRGHDGFLGSTPGPDANDPTWVKGVFFGSALRFDGIDDYAQVEDHADLHPQQLTVSLWFRANGTPGPFKYLMARGGDRCVASSYALETGYDGGLHFYVWDGESQHWSGSLDASIYDGKWHHVAGTWDGVNSKMFVDGKLAPGGTNYPGTIDYSGPQGPSILGGYHADCDLLFAGDIDQVMVWSTPLPVDEIWARFSALFQKPLTQ
jgi:hypothetical protein